MNKYHIVYIINFAPAQTLCFGKRESASIISHVENEFRDLLDGKEGITLAFTNSIYFDTEKSEKEVYEFLNTILSSISYPTQYPLKYTIRLDISIVQNDSNPIKIEYGLVHKWDF